MENRVKVLNSAKHKNNVLYLMNRDQRIHQNYSVQLGFDLSYESKSNFFIGFDYINMKMNERQKVFVLQGLAELSKESEKYSIPAYLLNDFKAFVKDFDIDCIVLDFSPLREITDRNRKIVEFCKAEKIALHICDSHNIVPCSLLKIYKRTPKAVKCDLYKLFNQYMVDFEDVEVHTHNKKNLKKVQIQAENKNRSFEDLLKLKYADCETFILPISQFIEENTKGLNKEYRFTGGYTEGIKTMNEFFKHRFKLYSSERNNPDIYALSDLSPWIHTGQLSTQYILGEATKKFKNSESLHTLIDEMFIWKEIAEHFVLHEPNYDNIKGALGWARETLKTHTKDKRSVVYSENEFRRAKTADKLWNAAQNELLIAGKIHGYVRMYWAKRLLEWTERPEEALALGIALNDEYSIDGNDPNGYLGVMWSVCGSMDRAFKERPVFGKIRFMSSFKCPGYISKWANFKK